MNANKPEPLEPAMLQNMTIAPVTDSETIAEVAALAREIWNQHFVGMIGQAQVDYMLDRFQSPAAIGAQLASGAEYHLARIDGEPCGYLGLIPNKPAGKLMLSKIYVKQSARGTGLGTALLDFTRQRARESGAESVWLTVNRGNLETIAWYKRKGFAVVDEKKMDIGSGFYMDDYIMELETARAAPGSGCPLSKAWWKPTAAPSGSATPAARSSPSACPSRNPS